VPLNGKNILKFSLLALLFLGLVVAWLGFGERGFIHLYRMDRERQTYLEKINALERENRSCWTRSGFCAPTGTMSRTLEEERWGWSKKTRSFTGLKQKKTTGNRRSETARMWKSEIRNKDNLPRRKQRGIDGQNSKPLSRQASEDSTLRD